jgi:hypothetical protein
VRVEVKTAPGDRAAVARELRTRIGGRLYREGIATRQDWRVEPPLPDGGALSASEVTASPSASGSALPPLPEA